MPCPAGHYMDNEAVSKQQTETLPGNTKQVMVKAEYIISSVQEVSVNSKFIFYANSDSST